MFGVDSYLWVGWYKMIQLIAAQQVISDYYFVEGPPNNEG
jgi:hypothetical protein